MFKAAKTARAVKAAYNSKRLSVSSKYFGNARFGSTGKSGKMNNYGKIKIGWSHIGTSAKGHANFRIGFKALGKKRHIHIVKKGPRLW